MRRWRVVVIDDNPEGSLEAVLLSPLVLARPLKSDATSAQKQTAVRENLLNRYLPLAPGEYYAVEADIDFQLRNFDRRRRDCGARLPIIEVERDFVRAWHLTTQLAKQPPDIVFLDVMFDQKTTATKDVQAIIDEIHVPDPTTNVGRPTVRELLSRGGLFLLGKLLRNQQVQQMPHIVLYSASRDVQSDFRPFEYASNGKFEVVVKELLRNSPERRRQVFRRRIRDYIVDGSVRADEVRAAVNLLASADAIAGDRKKLVQAFSHPIGSGWCFGAMFVAEAVAYLSAEPARRHAVIAELEAFLAPLAGDARSFVDFVERSPARLFSHVTPIPFSRWPPWLDSALGSQGNGDRHVVAIGDLASKIKDVRGEFQSAVRRLPIGIREALGALLDEPPPPTDTAAGLSAGTETRRRRVELLDKFVRSLPGYDMKWQMLLDQCRMTLPAMDIVLFVAKHVNSNGSLSLESVDPDVLSSKWDLSTKLELFLSPSSSAVKEPLASLLRAIVDGIRRYAYPNGKGAVHLHYLKLPCPSALQIEIRDEGSGFLDLRYYDPHGRGGDLSTALITAAGWFEVEIHSGGIKRRPTARGVGLTEASHVTRGTSYFIRIPAFELPEA